MFFRIGNVDSAKIDADIEANRDNFYRKDGVNYRSLHWWVSKAREAGDWTLDRVSIGLFRGVDEDEWSINTSRIMGVDGTDSESLTFGEREGREQVDEIFAFLKKYVPGCENAKLLQSGSTVGIRETRHIHGLTTLTIDDVLECRVPEDSIMLAANSVDVHGRFGPKSNEYITIPEGKFYGIPYGTLVPQNRSNLLVAGRCISAESEAAGAIRNASMLEGSIAAAKEMLESFSADVKIGSATKLWQAYRLRDALISQITYMTAMNEYVKAGGKSRGSAIYTSEKGNVPAKMEEVFRFELDTGDFDTTVLEINFADNCKATTRQVRPLPEGGGFFENVWREYRETKNIY
jgi:hypothetical protein